MDTKAYQSVYDVTEIHSVYNKSRNLPQGTLNMWMDVVGDNINSGEIKSIIDLGCGTGRFTNALSEKFKAEVTGVDPSAKMLSVAKGNISSARVNFASGNSGSIPAENSSVDLIFLSQVYHHIQDTDAFINESSRVLKANGYVCIRNSTVNNMPSYLYPRFFPAAYKIDMERLPKRENIISHFEENNFELVFTEPLSQIFALNHMEYYDKVSLRGCSDLLAISDDEFAEGLEKLKTYCLNVKNDNPVYEEIDLHIFSKL